MQCSKIKNILYTIFFFIQFISFFITIFKKDKNFTHASKIFLSLYIISLFTLLISHKIIPHISSKIITNNIGIINSDKGQGLLCLMIGIIYITSHNVSHVIFCLCSIGLGSIILLIELSKKKIDRKQLRTTETNLNISKESKKINGGTLDIRIDELNSSE